MAEEIGFRGRGEGWGYAVGVIFVIADFTEEEVSKSGHCQEQMFGILLVCIRGICGFDCSCGIAGCVAFNVAVD